MAQSDEIRIFIELETETLRGTRQGSLLFSKFEFSIKPDLMRGLSFS